MTRPATAPIVNYWQKMGKKKSRDGVAAGGRDDARAVPHRLDTVAGFTVPIADKRDT
jgi:hypothetical protein